MLISVPTLYRLASIPILLTAHHPFLLLLLFPLLGLLLYFTTPNPLQPIRDPAIPVDQDGRVLRG